LIRKEHKFIHPAWSSLMHLRKFLYFSFALSSLIISNYLIHNHQTINSPRVFLPYLVNTSPRNDWPQLGHDAQHTNYSPVQVDPPYCYAWKWYAVPIASRAQPIVSNGRLFIGGMDGVLYARNSYTGQPLWRFVTQGPIRNSPAVSNNIVITGSYDGFTYGLQANDGHLLWSTKTGPSVSAPLIDEIRSQIYVASGDGNVSALNLDDGKILWTASTKAPILTTPALSIDGTKLYIGDEDIQAFALDTKTGAEIWRTNLQGQSLSDRYPFVSGNRVIYRSQPLYFFHQLLHEGDTVMDEAGPVLSNWDSDWANVRGYIINYLSTDPSKQTFFVLNLFNGTQQGVAPVLYTYGDNDIPNLPVIADGNTYLTYRARHGIQTDGGSVHVSTKYDAELGSMDLDSLDIRGLQTSQKLGNPQLQFRMTSDEPSMLTMGGNILWVDNWERLGGLNVSNGNLIYAANVSNDWPECDVQCGPNGSNPYFPLSGSGAAYPFPSPRVTEGRVRGGVVIANNMLYWRVIEGGLAGISHQSGAACPPPQVWQDSANNSQSTQEQSVQKNPRPLDEYLTLDLTTPNPNPPSDLVTRINQEVANLLTTANGQHLLPFYLNRGMTDNNLWPYNSTTNDFPLITYNDDTVQGNAYWYDPGELIYTLALAYPYIDASLQNQVRNYVTGEMARYDPLQNLPYNDPTRDWLKTGAARERYSVPFRSSLNNWPPVATNITTLYDIWLWSKNTGDWSFIESHWSEAKSLYNNRKGNIRYYSDIAGLIGMYRLAEHFQDSATMDDAKQVAVIAMQKGLDFNTYRVSAEQDYMDPRNQTTGWYVPVFFGLTPEVGLYLREQIGQPAIDYLYSKEQGDGLQWWYLTRVGVHAEVGETSYIAPNAAWSHFLAHAYVVGDNQANLRNWLDRPWAPGDLYSLQKISAAIQASP
jgi:outer membrane protein assembly factor BamB